MAEFIRLDEQEQDAPILPDYPHSISNIKPDTKIIDGVIEKEEVEGICADYSVITINKIDSAEIEEEGVDHICIKDDCDTSKYYGCTGGDDGFQKENLFSELTDEYQRTIARINLGIADEYALKWGNIKGNLSNQKDLYTFVTDSIAFDINKVIDEINLKLAQWACEIEIRLNNKADIYSPSFTGTPTTTLPLMTDSSNRIASTEWVNARIEAAAIDENIKAISVDPEYMSYGDEPTDVIVTWEYYKDVTEQTINGVTLKPEARQYTFAGMTTSMVITLRYKYEDITAVKVVTFDIKYPNYYGTSPDYTKLNKTIDNIFTTTANGSEYIYVMIPNGSSAVLAVSSIIGGFRLLGTQEIFGNIYYIFKSANAGLGETTIEILSQAGFDSKGFDTTTIKELLASKVDKYTVYTKEEIDKKLQDIESGDIQLNNYYTKDEVKALIPDVSGKADIEDVPTKVSQLENDSHYITDIPDEYVTKHELDSRGYLTEEIEPAFIASAAATINTTDIQNWNNKVDKVQGMGLSEQSFTLEEKNKLKGLTNYSDTSVRELIKEVDEKVNTKADRSEIPDVSNKADIEDIPTKVSQLENDKHYLTTIPDNLVTEEELDSKGFLTGYIETDPTVPEWAKQPNKPTYTLEELGAERAGTAAEILEIANNFTRQQFDILTQDSDPSYNTFKEVGDAIIESNRTIATISTTLESKANKSELFSGKYQDLDGKPEIPSIEGLATEDYVKQAIANIPETDLSNYALKSELPDISTKVDKVEGKGLSTNDFTNENKAKLQSLENYNDTYVKEQIGLLNVFKSDVQGYIMHIEKALYLSENLSDYYTNSEEAYDFIVALSRARLVTLEYATLKFVTAYRKTATDTKDTDDVRTVEVIMMFHYDELQDLKLTFTLVVGTKTTYTFNKEFITSSSTGTEALVERLTALEKLVQGLDLSKTIVLE